MDLHELTAGYALDALDDDERARYEEHLAGCERCREELQGFWAVSGALGRVAGGPQPPASLRDRILEQARAESANVVPLRPRRVVPVLAAAASVAAVLALGLGLWSLSLAGELGERDDQLAVLADPNARTFPTANGEASLVVAPNGEAALVVRALAPAPEGRDYEVWVLEDGVPSRAGLFERTGVTLLDRDVRPGQTVAVTLERDGGVEVPTGSPLFTVARA